MKIILFSVYFIQTVIPSTSSPINDTENALAPVQDSNSTKRLIDYDGLTDLEANVTISSTTLEMTLTTISSVTFPQDVHTTPSSKDTVTSLTTPRPKWYHPIIWDNWSFWGSCSRTCGQGIKIRTRQCLVWTGDKFTRTHLTACNGKDIDYKICNRRKCSKSVTDNRLDQCNLLNRKPFSRQKFLHWKPYYAEDRPCDLNCKTDTRSSYYNFGLVQDGTRCYPTGNSICIRGQCKSVGCDGVVESSSHLDMCGVCNGKNDTCDLIQGKYISEFPSPDSEFVNYNLIVKIPRGSRHFKVLDNSRNDIALMDERNKFIVNGDRFVDKGGTYKVAGTKVIYIRREGLAEILQGQGPLTEDIYIMLLYRQKNYEVKYEYWQPRLNQMQRKPKHKGNKTSQSQRTNKPKQRLSEDPIWKLLLHGSDKTKGNSVTRKTRLSTRDRRLNMVNSNNISSSPERKRKIRYKHKKVKFNKNGCRPCVKVKNRFSEFCKSDFVAKMLIKGAEIIDTETRYDVVIMKNYKQGFHLMQREFLWVPNICKCPRLKIGRAFIVMGQVDTVRYRELRLTVSPNNYVRKHKPRYDLKFARMRNKRKCNKVQ